MKVFAHRGASGDFPENTKSAILEALKVGVDGIEVDIQSSFDDYMVIHDSWLDRTTSGKGRVSNFTAHELSKLDAGNGEKIPTLQQLFDWNNNKSLLNIELKHTFALERFVAQLEQNIEAKKISRTNILVSSFDHHQLQWLKNKLPWLKIGALTSSIPINYAKFASDLNAYSVHADKTFINKAFAEDAKKRGLKIYAYTVDRKEDIALMLEYGIDGIFTNYPARTKAYLLSLQKG
ncbi:MULTISPECIES: glycerophosphodiester phosphodiesterase family protein [Pseudoalteromonas]|jgi:glycerophosphoryl diester phosphodiesterase|uniref:glycerophosphodiester phosphodiesterase n=1 Tax=Pseudoalteromonas TaxID=53246 RepID=UPI000426E9BB|nr:MULTISPECIES: glycerophosphodiester phosphodiesterase family protein [Pseudoalteromonas]MBB1349630.1 glycerophosphodiester phosphodiesterase [Pseudoalteromonas sp. SG45-3]MBB1356633.1 glycerophosphodiester phosphodiesterase [Pseudoalteromonas sp. SG45-6]TVU72238.1 glycerophosphodiester phosphodiesterase [Pseudoalteromonas elyakovii]|tara:strand:- start:888 stop:1592 length:705 start_codon:yes stop_codon:yes gene_type:complete